METDTIWVQQFCVALGPGRWWRTPPMAFTLITEKLVEWRRQPQGGVSSRLELYLYLTLVACCWSIILQLSHSKRRSVWFLHTQNDSLPPCRSAILNGFCLSHKTWASISSFVNNGSLTWMGLVAGGIDLDGCLPSMQCRAGVWYPACLELEQRASSIAADFLPPPTKPSRCELNRKFVLPVYTRIHIKIHI